MDKGVGSGPISQRTIIIGAGVGGLSAAALITREGETLVLERASVPGGKMREAAVGGALIDAGPTVFTMKWVFDDLFARAGANFDDQVALTRLETLARHAWPDGSRFDLYADRQRAIDAVGAFAGAEEARRFARFLGDSARIYETLRDPFLRADRPSPLGLATGAPLARLAAIDPFATMWSALGRYFRDPRLRQLFGRYATYCGSSPFAAPATLMLVAHVEQDGVWSVDGGMRRLALALEALARANGAAFRYGAEVAEILIDRGRVAGVRLATGEVEPATTVIVNADAGALAAGLFGAAAARAIDAIPAARRSQSAMTFALVARTQGSALARHNVFFSGDYRSEFADVFAGQRMPASPTVYLCASNRIEDAPVAGAERLFLLVNAPAIGDQHRFSAREIDACRTKIMQRLAESGLTLRPEAETATTPTDFAAMFPGTGGALYGQISHGWRSAFRRPGVRTRIPGLYLAGGSVHPGPGVPMAALSGMAAAGAVMKDCASTSASAAKATRGGTSTP